MSFSSILSRNKKVEHHIKKKTHCFKIFGLEGDVNHLCGFDLGFIIVESIQ